MKHMFFVANWKANKSQEEAKEWIDYLSYSIYDLPSNKKIIVCPPVTLLSILKSSIVNRQSSITLGAQDVSRFDKGAYTGEIPAELLKEYVHYTLIGHSERREYFGEDDTVRQEKVAKALEAGLMPIYCVQNAEQKVANGVTIVAYEPKDAIGTGKPDTPENANAIAMSIKKKYPKVLVLYGGSVTPENVSSFTAQENLDGVLVGGASLDAQAFLQIIHHA